MAGHGFWTAPVAEGIQRKEIREAQETQIEETEGDCPGLFQASVVVPTPSPQPGLQQGTEQLESTKNLLISCFV
jgi:hypothetical protein